MINFLFQTVIFLFLNFADKLSIYFVFEKLIYWIILPLNNKISMLQKDKVTKIKSQIPSFNFLFFFLSLQSLLCNDFLSTLSDFWQFDYLLRTMIS